MTLLDPIRMTADQFIQLGDDPPGVRLELVNGEIFVSASPSTAHSHTALHLGALLLHYIESQNLGVLLSDTDHVLTVHEVRRPDLFYFAADRADLIGDGPIRHHPDLAVEIISPGSQLTDRIDKFEAYRAFGIPNYWIFDPINRTAKAFKLRRKKYTPAGSGTENSTVSFSPFPDLAINLATLWWPPKRFRK